MEAPHPVTGSKEEWLSYINTLNYDQADIDLLLYNRACDLVEETGRAEGLILAGANVDHCEGGIPILVEAMRYGYHQIVNLLLDAGCDPNAADSNNGITPVMVLIRGKAFSKELFEKFFDLGFDLAQTDNEGRDALDHVLITSNGEAMDVILRRAKVSHVRGLEGIMATDDLLFETADQLASGLDGQIRTRKAAYIKQKGIISSEALRVSKFRRGGM